MAGIASGFAALAEVDRTSLTTDEVRELNQGVQQLRSMADGACIQAAGVLDTSHAWAPDGARSPSAWLAWRCRIAQPRGSAALSQARALRTMPHVEAAVVAGEITTDHVKLFSAAARIAPDELPEAEERLVRLAAGMAMPVFEKRLRYWLQVHAPDGDDADAQDAFERREAHASTSFEGTVITNALLDPVGGAIWVRELQRLEQELFEADWADARARKGQAATVADLRRTPKQRRADAMVEMARRSAARPADATEPRVLLQGLVGEDTLKRMCELSNGRIVAPGQLVPLLPWADVQRIVFSGRSRVLDVGVRTRLFSGATRIAVEARDRECFHPSCHVPAERCELDHIVPYAAGGETTQANGRPGCGFHHRDAHQRPPPPAA